MPAESMPMYGMFSMGAPPPLPEYAPPSYDSHNFNHPPPRTQVTVSAGQDSNSYSHPPPRAPPIAEHDPHIYSQPPPTVSFTVSSGHGLHDSGIGSQSNDLLPPAYWNIQWNSHHLLFFFFRLLICGLCCLWYIFVHLLLEMFTLTYYLYDTFISFVDYIFYSWYMTCFSSSYRRNHLNKSWYLNFSCRIQIICCTIKPWFRVIVGTQGISIRCKHFSYLPTGWKKCNC